MAGHFTRSSERRKSDSHLHLNISIDSSTTVDEIKHAVMPQFPITHPFEEDLSFLYGTIFTGPPHDPITSQSQRLHLRRR